MKMIKTIMDVPKDLYAMWMARGIKLGTLLNEVLDEIRAEIDEQIDLHDTPFEIDDGMDASFCDGLNKAKEIIDKYREEKE